MSGAAKLPATIDMSALSALLAIRAYSETHADAPLEEVIEALGRSDTDMSAINFSIGAALHVGLGSLPVANPADFFRVVLHEWIVDQLPWWLRLFPYGRERVLPQLKREEVQCLRAAGLLQNPPSPEVSSWWDRLATLRRSHEDDALMLQGRQAERWSMEHEINRLESLGIAFRPKWTAIEDNNAGFDIQSYDRGDVEPISRLIEVKSSTQTPPRIVVTRNEWDTAVKFGLAYHFHIWSVPARQLRELTAAEIAPHIPADRGGGRWSEVVLRIK
ncbi:MAG: DUF3883 domain-containing protein [Candidatus Eremiobacteraeota bacterium]|nr:DUF3883 domain-containing protein [Candidatus Eremiobacteraeota bacterium]